MADELLRGPAEARLLHVERGVEQLLRDARVSQRKLIALGQGIWSEWSDVASPTTPTPTPTPSPTPTFGACCTTIAPGSTIAFTDSVWGSGTLVWDATHSVWYCWLPISWPGAGACGACSTAILYTFDVSGGTPTLFMYWAYDNSSFCPVAITPPSTPTYPSYVPPGAGFHPVGYGSPGGGTSVYCDTTPMTALTSMSASSPELLLRTGHSAETITLTFAGSTATNTTSDFGGICSCLPWTVTLNDSVYGNITLTYNPILEAWVGCTTASYAGTVDCASGTIAITYTLEGDLYSSSWTLRVGWPSHLVSGHTCPLPGATCASAIGTTRQVSTTISCTAANTFTFGTSAASPWPGTGGATCSVTF